VFFISLAMFLRLSYPLLPHTYKSTFLVSAFCRNRSGRTETTSKPALTGETADN